MLNYVFLLGRGRSGTTWVGKVLNTYKNCIYKFEPFNTGKSELYSQWLVSLENSKDIEKLRKNFEHIVSSCELHVDYPPFVIKNSRKQSPLLLRILWQIGKTNSKLKWLYEEYGKPNYQENDFVLIKQVNFPNELLVKLANVLTPKIIILIREPYASVSSALEFYKNERSEFKTPHSCERVLSLINREDHQEFKHYAPLINDLSPPAFEALRWRIQTEPLVAFSEKYPNCYVIKYEDLILRPEQEFKKLLDFLGWSTEVPISKVIERSRKKSFLKEIFKKKHYRTNRGNEDFLNKWKKTLTPFEIDEIKKIIEESRINHIWASKRQESKSFTHRVNIG